MTDDVDWHDWPPTSMSKLEEQVTHEKPPAIAYIDDRAVPFTGRWGTVWDGVRRLVDGPVHGHGRGS